MVAVETNQRTVGRLGNAWRRHRQRVAARRAEDERIELLAEFLAEDVAGPWVTPADVAEAGATPRPRTVTPDCQYLAAIERPRLGADTPVPRP